MTGVSVSNLRVSRIHIGEWDSESNPDCILGDCAPQVQKIPVARKIPHPEYHETRRKNDIALIRLAQPALYNDFVQPICLPMDSTLSTKLHAGESLVVTGWGRTETGRHSTKKLKVFLKGVENSACNATYSRRNLDIDSTQVCAGGEQGVDSCSGDSGGPLIALDRRNVTQMYMYLVGVVSYGPTSCGQLGWPGVYTKVSEYMDWIQNNLEE